MSYLEVNEISLSKELISTKSESPASMEIVNLVCKYLESFGFTCYKVQFGETANLYAEKGKGKNNLCFSGHFDVVPAGSGWDSDPYSPLEHNGYLIGRGASDMKCAIAAFIIASRDYKLQENEKISLLITGNEEGDPKDGMVSMIEWLKEKNINLTACIIGEPTAREKLGDMIKNGRRGSFTFNLTFHGKQGHVAYPHNAINPVDALARSIIKLKETNMAENKILKEFNLEFVAINTSSQVSNVIPQEATCLCNIRFNNNYNKTKLLQIVKNELKEEKYTLKEVSYSDAFLCQDAFLQKCGEKAILEVTGLNTEISTEGGTSDGRFLKDITQIIEIGLPNKTAHQANEKVLISEIQQLKVIYSKFIEYYFILDGKFN